MVLVSLEMVMTYTQDLNVTRDVCMLRVHLSGRRARHLELSLMMAIDPRLGAKGSLRYLPEVLMRMILSFIDAKPLIDLMYDAR
jgi:hypothetical protein